MSAFDVVPVGHFVIDSIFLQDRTTPFVVLGGSVTYVSLIARSLRARVSVVSKVGSDFPDAFLRQLEGEGIDLSNVVRDDDALTTRFELRYADGFDRTLRLQKRASPLAVEEVEHLPMSQVVHLGPVAGEIPYEVIEKLRDRCKFMSLDPQGLVRSFDEEGNVSVGPLSDMRVLEHIDIFKSSQEEIRSITGCLELEKAVKVVHDHGTNIVIVTLGGRGAMVSFEGAMHKVTAFKPAKVVDPTGAGDAFIGGFLAEYVRDQDCLWSSCVGGGASSIAIENVGPTFYVNSDEIYRRSLFLYEKGIKE